jgi:phosphate starvation-inducible PhoH-like protein
MTSTPKTQFKPKSSNQTDYVRAIAENDLVFCIGPAGSGKSACSVGVAVQYLMEGKVKQIVVCRPTLGCLGEKGSEMGFLPGTLNEKIDPYIQNIYDELSKYFERKDVNKMIEEGVIRILPLYYCRGLTFHDAFVIVDEAQNAIHHELKAITTRLGSRSKMVINGDLEQSDLRTDDNPLKFWINEILKDDKLVPIIQLDIVDIVRHPVVKHIILRVREWEKAGNKV